MVEHEFIEVGHRRWCLNCSLWQMSKSGRWPKMGPCARNTPRAIAKDRADGEKALQSRPPSGS